MLLSGQNRVFLQESKMIMLDNWQRIEQVIKWSGIASVSAFAREIGLNRGENLYQIKRGNNGISRDLADSIAAKYPQISKAWLLTGEGEMLPGTTTKERFDIPFFKADVTSVKEPLNPAGHTYYVSFPMFNGADFAAFTFADAMEPEIPKGAIGFFQKTEAGNLMPGGVYYIESTKFNGIRYVRNSNKKGMLRLVPKNTKDYDEITIDLSDVKSIYRVRGVVIDKSV